MKSNLFLVSIHSDRPFYDKTFYLIYLQKKFLIKSNKKNLSFQDSVPYKGKLCFWEYYNDKKINKKYFYTPNFKVQYVTKTDNKIIILGADRVQILNKGKIENIYNNLFFGCHIVNPDYSRKEIVWISSAVSNRIIKFNVRTKKIENEILMPKKYGNKYVKNIDYKKSYINTDNQNTHLNSVFSHKNRLYVTFWKQGILGYFENDKFYEILRGFIGLHSVRIWKNLIYFTDSSNSSLVIIDLATFQIINRIKFQNKYVHDVYILDNKKLFYTSEKNEIVLYNYKSHQILNKLNTISAGGSIQFLNVLNIKNLNSFKDLKKFSENKKIKQILKIENNFKNFDKFNLLYNKNNFFYFGETKYQYILKYSKKIEINPGTYFLTMKFKKLFGNIVIDFLDEISQEFLNQEKLEETSDTLDGNYNFIRFKFEIKKKKKFSLIISGNNHTPGEIIFFINQIALEKM